MEASEPPEPARESTSARHRRVRRRRARELRRRRLRALGALAALAAVAGAVVGAGADSQQDSAPEAALPAACSGEGVAAWGRLAGQRLVVSTDGAPDKALRTRARRGEIAGVIVFPDAELEQKQIRTGLSALQGAAADGGHPPLVIATDQEGGPVERFTGAPPLRSPLTLGESFEASDARLEGQATGNFLREVAINTDLAPVLDIPASADSVIAQRAFGDGPGQVTRLGLAFARGLAEEGVAATAKHFPGLGRATVNTDFAPEEIGASARALRADLRPFRRAAAAGVPLMMVANAAYPALGARDPAVFSPRVVQDLLRQRVGFEGASITDDLQAGAIGLPAAEAAQRAARAGVDLLLFAKDGASGIHGRLAASLADGRLEIDSARRSCARVVALRESLAEGGAGLSLP